MSRLSFAASLLGLLLVSALAQGAPHHHRRAARAVHTRATRTTYARAATAHRAKSLRARLCPAKQLGQKSVSLRPYRIARGDSLSVIAYRHGTTVGALAAANGLKRNDIIRAGQVLVIPQSLRPGGGDDWLKYARAPAHPGLVHLVGYKHHFRGQVLVHGHVSHAARRQISLVLGATGSRPAVPERLIRLIVRVSDTFGGRPLRVVSGFRTRSYYSDSRHKLSSAVDFSIPGIPNSIVRQYLLLFDNVGVGYYPNSSFVHFDVRPCPVQWVDYAGPGQAPRSSPRTRLAKAKQPSPEDLDEIAEAVVAEMQTAPPDRKTGTPRDTAGDVALPVDGDEDAPRTGTNDAAEPELPQSTESPEVATNDETPKLARAHGNKTSSTHGGR